MTRKQIAQRWGVPFWLLLSDIFDQGFNRTQAARIVGMQPRYLSSLLTKYRDKSPWGSPNVIANYVRDTGEPFMDALLRMQKEGFGYGSAARAFGYVGKGAATALRHAMASRGIDIKFKWVRPIKKKPVRVGRGLNMGKGWPTWEKIYAMHR